MTATGALLLGTDLRALGIARSLGRRGIPVVAVHHEGSTAVPSRYLSRRLAWPDGDDERRLDRLLLLGTTGYRRWTLFPTADDTAALVSRHHEALSSAFVLTTPPWPVFEQAFDKRAIHAAAGRSGIQCPATITVSSVEELPADLNFPVVVKAAVRLHPTLFTEAKGWRADEPGQLRDVWRRARRYADADEILIQAFVPGDGRNQFSYGALCRAGETLAAVTARRTRQYPRELGHSSCLVETIRDEEVENLGRTFLASIGYSGLVEVEMKRDAVTGELLLLDVNPRVWTWHSLAGRAGADLPYLAWRAAAGQTVDPVTARPGVRWCRPATDLPSALGDARAGALTARGWLSSLHPPIEIAPFARDDPRPGLCELPLLAVRRAARSSARVVGPIRANATARRAGRIVASFARESAATADRLVERLGERRQPPAPEYEFQAHSEQELHRLLGVPWPCGEEPAFALAWSGVLARLEQRGVPVGSGTYAGWNDGDLAFARAAWCAARHLPARTVVETGVARGLVSAIVLHALRTVGDARLYSIGLAPPTATVDYAGIAVAVDPEQHERWTYVAGSSRQRLPGLLRTIPTVDLFIHDNLHTDRNLRFELGCVLPHLSARSVVLAGDVDCNAEIAYWLRRSPGGFFAAHDRDGGGFGGSVHAGASDGTGAHDDAPPRVIRDGASSPAVDRSPL
ncbi:MAG: D-aspartate ligase [Frankiales bacterium]|jgi:predicted ATP-grasp superfamily ATP-dependent carboligase|nr:D-aspartate ligase [Frankiales bacterium]